MVSKKEELTLEGIKEKLAPEQVVALNKVTKQDAEFGQWLVNEIVNSVSKLGTGAKQITEIIHLKQLLSEKLAEFPNIFHSGEHEQLALAFGHLLRNLTKSSVSESGRVETASV